MAKRVFDELQIVDRCCGCTLPLEAALRCVSGPTTIRKSKRANPPALENGAPVLSQQR